MGDRSMHESDGDGVDVVAGVDMNKHPVDTEEEDANCGRDAPLLDDDVVEAGNDNKLLLKSILMMMIDFLFFCR